MVAGRVTTTDWTQETLPTWLDSIWQGIIRPKGLLKFGVVGFIKSLREVPTFLLMRLAFGARLCRFGMFRAVRAASSEKSSPTVVSEQNSNQVVHS